MSHDKIVSALLLFAAALLAATLFIAGAIWRTRVAP